MIGLFYKINKQLPVDKKNKQSLFVVLKNFSIQPLDKIKQLFINNIVPVTTNDMKNIIFLYVLLDFCRSIQSTCIQSRIFSKCPRFYLEQKKQYVCYRAVFQ